MIPAAKSRFFTGWLSRDAEKRIQRTFGLVAVRGLAPVRASLESGPVLVISNHSSWWDPIVLQWMCHRVLRGDAFAMMDAKNLRRLPFFKKVGAFGVDLDEPADGARAIRHTVKLLDRPGRLVWIFPQGKEAPLAQRPLGFRAGSEEIGRIAAKRSRAVVIPAAIRYAFGGEPLPELHISFGAPTSGDHEAAVAAILDTLDSQTDFEVLHRRSMSPFLKIAEKVLAWVAR